MRQRPRQAVNFSAAPQRGSANAAGRYSLPRLRPLPGGVLTCANLLFACARDVRSVLNAFAAPHLGPVPHLTNVGVGGAP